MSSAFQSEAGNRRQGSQFPFGRQPLLAGGGRGAPGSFGQAGESPGLYGGTLEGVHFGNRRQDGRHLLSASSFHVTSGDGEGTGNDRGAKWAAWGGGVTTQFSGRESDLSLNGGVSTGLFGVDYERGRILAGLAISHSSGDGDVVPARDRQTGFRDTALMGSLTSLFPYLRVNLTDRVTTWGLFGQGRGEMGPAGEAGAVRNDIGMTMAAVGARGSLLKAEQLKGFELALKSDTFVAGMDLESATGRRITDADASRTRLLLEGSRDGLPAWGGVLGHSVEFGIRRDGGSAETGVGLEMGGSLRYVNQNRGLTVSVTARRLMAHEDDDYREWGVGGIVEYDPGAKGRGLAVRMVSSWGTAPGGSNRLWSQSEPGFSRHGYGASEAPLSTEVDYQMRPFGGHLEMAPYFDMSLVGAGSHPQHYVLGWRLKFGPIIRLHLEIDLVDGTPDPLSQHGLFGPGSMLTNPGRLGISPR